MSDQEFLTPDEVARLLHYEVTKVYELIEQGGLPALRFGGRFLISRSALNLYLRLVQRDGGPTRVRPTRPRHAVPERSAPGEHLVYVVESDYGVKVGITAAIQARERLAAIEAACGLALRLIRTYAFADKVAAFTAEQAAHLRLAETRMHGEWFYCHPLEATAVLDRLYADTRMGATA